VLKNDSKSNWTRLKWLVIVIATIGLSAYIGSYRSGRGSIFNDSSRIADDPFRQHINEAEKLLRDSQDPSDDRPDKMPENDTEAACEYQRALAIRPGNWEAMEGLAKTYIEMSEYFKGQSKTDLLEDGVFFLRKSVNLIPGRDLKAEDWWEIERAELLLGDEVEALKAAQEVIKLKPELAPDLFIGKKLKPPSQVP